MTAAFFALLLGTLVPGLVALITKTHASSKLKAVLSAFLSAISGAVSGYIASVPAGEARWTQVGFSVLLAVVAAASTYLGLWKPSGASPAMARWLPNFGLGSGPSELSG